MNRTEFETIYQGLKAQEPNAMDAFLEGIKTGAINFSDIKNVGLPKYAMYALVHHGLLLDEMVESQVPQYQRALIRHGLKTEYYEKWKDNKDVGIRVTLAKKGYFINQYLTDKDVSVRWHALRQKPEYIPYHFRDKQLIEQINDYYLGHIYPNLDDYAIFLELNREQLKERHMIVPDTQIIKRKQASLGQPSTLEMSMTERQLYEAGSPYWARHQNLYHLMTVRSMEERNAGTDEILAYVGIQ